MKKVDVKLLIIEMVLLIFLILNSFITNILSRYNLIICLVLLLLVFKYFFGKKKHEILYAKGASIEISIFMLLFFILYYVCGLKIGFYSAGNYFTLKGLTDYFIPIILIVVFKELLRYKIVINNNGSMVVSIATIAIFLFLDVTNYLYYNSYGSIYDVTGFIFMSLIPAISTNIACTYVARNAGFLPNIIYLLAINLYVYIFPVLPNKHEYIYAVIQVLIPIVLMVRMYLLFNKNKKLEDVVDS